LKSPDSQVKLYQLRGEDVLARVDGRLQVQRAELRRRTQQHHVAAGDHLLVGVEADEAAVLDVDPGGHVRVFREEGQAVLKAILKGVGHRDQLDVLVGLERLAGGPGAAAAAADQADAEQVAAGGVDVRDGRQGAGNGGGLEEGTAGRCGRHGGSFHFFSGCSSNLRTNSSNPSHCNITFPAEGKTS
jgi:hypothetical protein